MLLILLVQELASACFTHLLELLGSLLSFAIFAFSFLSGVSVAFAFVLWFIIDQMDTVSSLQLRCLRLFDSHWSPFLHLCTESPSWVNECRRLSVLIFCRRRRFSEVSVGAVALTCESSVTRSSNEQDLHAAHEAACLQILFAESEGFLCGAGIRTPGK